MSHVLIQVDPGDSVEVADSNLGEREEFRIAIGERCRMYIQRAEAEKLRDTLIEKLAEDPS